MIAIWIVKSKKYDGREGKNRKKIKMLKGKRVTTKDKALSATCDIVTSVTPYL